MQGIKPKTKCKLKSNTTPSNGKQIDPWNLWDENANATPLHDLDCDTLMKIADYCLNFKPTTNND